MNTIKCISLWQPWASLCVTPHPNVISSGKPVALKPVETRSWKTDYRGPLLIHASQKNVVNDFRDEYPFRNYMENIEPLPFGKIIGMVELVEIFTTDDWMELFFSPLGLGKEILGFGDFSIGRFAWCFGDYVRFEKPITFKGQQRLFDVPSNLITEVTSTGSVTGKEEVGK